MFPDWTGRTALVLASGPSGASIVAELFERGYAGEVIAVNRSFELLAAVDRESTAVLYAADRSFWAFTPGAREFPGLKLCADPEASRVSPAIGCVTIPKSQGFYHARMIRQPVGTIGSGGNSGFQAVNLAVQFGAAQILLAGLDYVGEHWHGRHVVPLNDPPPLSLVAWRNALDAEANTLAAWGIDVVNLSSLSTLRNFRKAAAREISPIISP